MKKIIKGNFYTLHFGSHIITAKATIKKENGYNFSYIISGNKGKLTRKSLFLNNLEIKKYIK